MRSVNRLPSLLPWFALAWTGLAAASPPDPPEAWLSAVERGLAASEYHLSRHDGGGFTAPNRAQGLRARWRDGSLLVTPRTGGTSWALRYEFAGVGRTGPAAQAAGVSHEDVGGGRIEWERGPDLREWYLNDERGIEQVFVVEERPAGDPRDPVAIDGWIDGLLAYAAGDGQSILLRTPAGVDALRISQLVVRDANGAMLPACLDVAPGMLSIVVDDSAATYPITVDPLLTSPAWTRESDQIDARLAGSIGAAGDVNGDGFSDVIVGASFFDNGEANEGRAFVYHGSAAGLATTPAWMAESDQVDAAFGVSVATAGDVNGDGFSDVIIGATGFDAGQIDEGRAFLYRGSAAGLEAAAAWTAESNQDDAAFGNAVATAGDVNGDGRDDVIVGVRLFDNPELDEGQARIYLGTPAGLALSPAWTIEGNQDGADLGISVAMAGDVNGDGLSDVVVGADLFDGGQVDEGAAFLYFGSPTIMATVADWVVEADQAAALFGYSVATAGDVNGDGFSDVIVGAYRFDAGTSDEGRAFVFYGSALGPTTTADWTAESDQDTAHFGYAVATAGDVNGDGYAEVLVGAPMFDNVETDEGRAFVFMGSPSGPGLAAAWTAESDSTRASLGRSVSPAGDVNGDGYSDVIVGAPTLANGHREEGRVYAFHGSTSGLAAAAGWTAESEQDNAIMGISVASAGDVNGDGYSDIIVGAWQFDDGENDEGAAFAYLGSPAGPSATPSWTATSNQISAYFGGAVATAGDVNGDGYSDVIVAAYRFDNGQTDEGRVFVYRGSAAGLEPAESWTAEIDQAAVLFGTSVGTAGDVNGDGYSDVIVGAPFSESGQTDEGRAFVYHGSATGLGAAPAWIGEINQLDAQFGTSVATAGDVNGDGYSDVVVGAPTSSNPQSREGRAFVFHGSATGLGTTAAWITESDQAFANHGSAVATAGDVNGDGYSDILVGDSHYDEGQSDEGKAFLYQGSAAGLSTTPAWSAQGDQINAFFGACVATAGDVNADGYSDVLIGAYSYDNGQSDEGRLFVYHGAASGLSPAAAWTAEPDQALAHLGLSAGTAGDVNGDGYSDVIAGAYWFDNGHTDEGSALLWYGNQGDGLDRLPRQIRYDGNRSIDLLGIGDATSGFKIRCRARSPFGRGKVQLEAEVKPLGRPFDGTGILLSAFTDTGIPGPEGSFADLDVLQVPLSVEPHHWRARLRTRYPFHWQSHWMTLPGNAVTETDLRGAIAPLSCDAGPPQVLDCMLGTVTVDGSGSSGPADRTYLWSCPNPSVQILSPTSAVTDVNLTAAGNFVLTLTVTSAIEVLTCDTTVRAGDIQPPVIACPPTATASASEPGGAFVDVQGVATDDCDTRITVQNDQTTRGSDASDVYPCGETVVNFLALDDAGRVGRCTTIVTVTEAAPPLEISAVGATVPLRVTKDSAAGMLHVTFEDHAQPTELTALYAGTILPTGLVAYDHVPVLCKVAPTSLSPGIVELVTSWDAGASHYYLVSALNCAGESARGFRSNGTEHPAFPTDCGPLP